MGCPGSGKSTYCNKYKDKKDYIVISSDSVREELGDINDQSRNNEVFKIVHERTKYALINGFNVIQDSTNLSRKNRRHTLEQLKNIHCEKVCVLFATPYELALARNFARDRQVPEGVIARMYKSFEVPCLQEGFDDIQIVWADYKDMPGFEYDIMADLKKWKTISHDNPHHCLNIGDHMMKAYSHYISEYDIIDDYLKWSILMHDCGKNSVKSFCDSHGEPSEIAHFYSHENIGAFLSLFYLRRLCSLWSDKDIIYMSLLINLHMRPYVWEQSEKAKQNDLKLFGSDIVNDIYILNKCDKAAH